MHVCFIQSLRCTNAPMAQAVRVSVGRDAGAFEPVRSKSSTDTRRFGALGAPRPPAAE